MLPEDQRCSTCGGGSNGDWHTIDCELRFDAVGLAYKQGVAAERERCAKMAESMFIVRNDLKNFVYEDDVAAAIRRDE